MAQMGKKEVGFQSKWHLTSVTWKANAEQTQEHVNIGRGPTWVTAAQFLMSPWVALKDKQTNCDPKAT